ncbi:MAG: DUF1801 domain-containing protein [Arachnia sp.]
MAKTHPHIDSPTRDQLAALVEGRPKELVEVYLALHDLVVETLPDVKVSVDTVDASIGYGAHQYGYNGWGLAALTPFTKWVSLTLLQGAHLEDPEGLLTGTTTMRHVKVASLVELVSASTGISTLIDRAGQLIES